MSFIFCLTSIDLTFVNYFSFLFFLGQAVEASLEEMKMRMMEAEKQWQDFITPGGQGGKGLSVPFEQYVRGILATGCSAKAARGTIAMSAKTFLDATCYKDLHKMLPLERWFRTQREGLGNDAWTYAMIRVAGAERILQWGFDETKLDVYHEPVGVDSGGR